MNNLIKIILLCMAVVSCKEKATVNEIFVEFKPLKLDSSVYFDIKSQNGKWVYQFNSFDKGDVSVSDINFGQGEIKHINYVIFISPAYKDSRFNIQDMELFNFGLKKKQIKECSFKSNNKTYNYQLMLRDLHVTTSDSLFWFQMKNNKILSCEISNYIVSRKEGILSVFESYRDNDSLTFAVNIVGRIPEAFNKKVRITEGIIQ